MAGQLDQNGSSTHSKEPSDCTVVNTEAGGEGHPDKPSFNSNVSK